MQRIDVPALIMNEFKKLARTRSIESIRVKDICERCSITRQTFYKYFHDKFDLLSRIYRMTITETMEEIDESVPWDIVIGMMLAKVRDDREFYLNALRYQGQNNLREMMLYHIYNDYVVEFARRHGTEPDEHALFELRFNAYGGTGIMLDWMHSGMSTDPYVLSSNIFSCMPAKVKAYFQ